MTICASEDRYLQMFRGRIRIVCLALLGLAMPAGAAAQGLEAVSAAYVGTASDIGFYLADRKGYFRAEGLDVTLTQLDVTNKMVPMLATAIFMPLRSAKSL